MSENNLPKEIVDTSDKWADDYSRHDKWFTPKEMFEAGAEAAALHYSQIIEQKDATIKTFTDTIIGYSEGIVRQSSEIEQLKAENERLKEIQKRIAFYLGGWREAVAMIEELSGNPVRLQNMMAALNQIDDISKLLNSEQNLERSVATEAKSELPDADNIVGTFKFDHDKQDETYTPNPNFGKEKKSEISKLQSQIKGLVEGLKEIRNESNEFDSPTHNRITNIADILLTNYHNSIK